MSKPMWAVTAAISVLGTYQLWRRRPPVKRAGMIDELNLGRRPPPLCSDEEYRGPRVVPDHPVYWPRSG